MQWQVVAEKSLVILRTVFTVTYEGIDFLTARAVRDWATHGWLVLPLLPYTNINNAEKLLTAPASELPGVRERAELTLIEWFDTLRHPLSERCRHNLASLELPFGEERVALFEQALKAYCHRCYGLVAPTLYTQVEGIIGSLEGYTGKNTYSRRTGEVSARNDLITALRGGKTYPLPRVGDAKAEATSACFTLLSGRSDAPHVTRNQVAHGGVGFNSKREAVRALLFYMGVVKLLADAQR